MGLRSLRCAGALSRVGSSPHIVLGDVLASQVHASHHQRNFSAVAVVRLPLLPVLDQITIGVPKIPCGTRNESEPRKREQSAHVDNRRPCSWTGRAALATGNRVGQTHIRELITVTQPVSSRRVLRGSRADLQSGKEGPVV